MSSSATALGFDTFVFGIVANDRRPDAESRTYVITNQADTMGRMYDERAYLELDPRVELAAEPGYAFWEAQAVRQESSSQGVPKGIGRLTASNPVWSLGSVRAIRLPTRCWRLTARRPHFIAGRAEQRLLIAGQASILGKVLSRTVRRFLNEQELLFPAPPMKLNVREREILTLAASGKTSKEIAAAVGVAKITVDMHVGAILSKMGALNRNQAIAKAIANKLIYVPDDVHAEYKSAKLNATRKAHRDVGAAEPATIKSKPVGSPRSDRDATLRRNVLLAAR